MVIAIVTADRCIVEAKNRNDWETSVGGFALLPISISASSSWLLPWMILNVICLDNVSLVESRPLFDPLASLAVLNVMLAPEFWSPQQMQT